MLEPHNPEKTHNRFFRCIRNSVRSFPWLFTLCTSGMIFAFFGKVLLGKEQFAFRDGAHFYFPLFRYIQEELRAGRLPLWMPYENFGQPLAANPVSSVFYPLKTLFFLPLDFTFAYHLYIIAHVFLAAATMYRLARFFHCSTAASTLAGCAYAFGGSVVYQHLNVIFLIGAAWFPTLLHLAFAKKKCDRILNALMRRQEKTQGHRKILPNEPRAVLAGHKGIPLHSATSGRGSWRVSFLWNSFFSDSFPGTLAFANKRTKTISYQIAIVLALMVLGGDVQAAYHGGIVLLILLGPRRCFVPFVFAGLLAAVQVLPSWEYARYSDRAPAEVPRSIWDIPRAKDASAMQEGILCRNLNAKSHARTSYLYSTPPWRVAEFFWPNISGRQFPINTRWTAATVWDRQVWVPSLYCGIVPALLAVSSFRLFRRKKYCNDKKPLVFLSWFFLIALLGSFGLFGLGWFVNVFCYNSQHFGDSPSGIGHPVGGVYWLMNVFLPAYAQFRYPGKLLCLAAVPFSLLAAFAWDRAFSGKSSVTFFSLVTITISVALLVLLSFNDLWWTFTAATPPCTLFGPFEPEASQVTLFTAFYQSVFVLCAFLLLRRRSGKWAMLAVLLVGVDLACANRWMIPSVPRETFTVESPLPKTPARIYRAPLWYPLSFSRYSGASRLEESVVFDRLTLWPKYHLENRHTQVEAQGTMYLRSYAEYMKRLRAETQTPFEDRLARLGVRYVIVPTQRGGRPFRLHPGKARLEHLDLSYDYAIWEIIVNRDEDDAVKTVLYEPNRVVYETNFTQEQTFVIPEQYYPGWKAKLVSESGETTHVPVFPVENVFRGVKVPSGPQRLILQYRPTLLYFGFGVSAFAWIFVTFRLVFRPKLHREGAKFAKEEKRDSTKTS